MYKLIPGLCLFISISAAFAQNKATVKGKVTDSLKNDALEFATVAIVNMKDTTSELISYTLSDKKGEFALHNLPSGIPVKVLITFVGYKPFRKLLTLAKGENVDLGNIRLSAKLLNEVSITGERLPIIVKKDTVEFAAEAFKTRPNAVVEELLKKLPGMEVDNDGTIMFNGKKVNKIMVDGREFFRNDPRIASKNLDAELIDKIQVYDDRENDPNHLIEEARVEKIINLKFKKKLRKSVFGKVYGGAGTEGRYESGGLFNMFRDTLQISLLGLSNNLSNTGFSYNDLYETGGLNRGGTAISRYGANFGGYRGGGGGIQQTTSGGVNVNTDYGKKFKLNLAYYYSDTHTDQNSISNRQQLTGNTNFITDLISGRSRVDRRQNISATVRIKPDDKTEIKYEPLLSYSNNNGNGSSKSDSYSNFIPLINNSTSQDNSNGNNLQFSHDLSYNHQYKKEGESIDVTQNVQINPSNNYNYNINQLTSYVSTFPSYNLNRYATSKNDDVVVNLVGSYRYPVSKKFTADITVSTDYNKVLSNAFTFDFNPNTGLYDLFSADLSSDLTRNQWGQRVSPGITYNITKKLTFVMSVAAQWLQVNDAFGRGSANRQQDYFNLLPTARLTAGSVSFNYSKSVSLPNVGDLIPYSIVYSPLYSVTGNPSLKQTERHNFSINYYAYKQESQLNLNSNLNFTYEQNGVFRQRTLSTDGVETSTPINQNGRYNTYFYTNVYKRFKKRNNLTFGSGTGLNLGQSHNFFELNGQDGYQNTYTASLNERLSINWKDIITLDPSYYFSESFTAYTGVAYSNVNFASHSLDMPFNIFWPKRMNIAGTYTYTYSPVVSPGYQKSTNLLNLSVAREFLKKDRGEIKLSCYDILNQAVSSNRSVYENVISDSQSQIIRRYFLLTLQWKFNSIKVDEKKKSLIGPLIMR